MAWCEENRIDYIFGLAGNDVLGEQIRDVADDLCVCRAEAGEEKRRTWMAFDYAAKSWDKPRRVVARLEATARGFDARYIVTTLKGSPERLYETDYCARGQAENFIKLHKIQLASDRTSAAPEPISSVSSCTPPPTGCCTPCALLRRQLPSGPWRSSRHCDCA
jgi:hypothetical protein